MNHEQEDNDLNELMKELVPEGSSSLTLFPEQFRSPADLLDNGIQCFIPASKPGNMRQDYIWVPEQRRSRRPAGYYHMTTREASVEIYSRIQKVCPGLPSL